MNAVQGCERLREQLSSIRQSIVRFEHELSAGAERKQKENDAKFETLRKKIDEISALVDNEAARVELEIESTEKDAQQTISVVADNVVKLFTKKIEMAAKPFDLYASTCESLRARLDRVEARKRKSTVSDELQSLQEEVSSVRSMVEDYRDEQDLAEKEIMRSVVHLQNSTDQQMDYWVLLLNDGMSEMRSAFNKAAGRSTDAEHAPVSQAAEIEKLSRDAAAGKVLPPEEFVELARALLTSTSQSIAEIKAEREQADEDIIMAVQKYTKTLRKSLEAAEMLKSFAEDIAKEV